MIDLDPNFAPTPHDVEWSRRHFATLKDGGAWAVPRSGLIFRRQGDSLVLTATMPHSAEMPITAEQLREQQDRDFNIIKSAFGAAGIEVRKL